MFKPGSNIGDDHANVKLHHRALVDVTRTTEQVASVVYCSKVPPPAGDHDDHTPTVVHPPELVPPPAAVHRVNKKLRPPPLATPTPDCELKPKSSSASKQHSWTVDASSSDHDWYVFDTTGEHPVEVVKEESHQDVEPVGEVIGDPDDLDITADDVMANLDKMSPDELLEQMMNLLSGPVLPEV